MVPASTLSLARFDDMCRHVSRNMADIFLSRRLSDPRFASRRVDATSATAITPWYSTGSRPAPVTGAIQKTRHNFAEKRKKYYSSDSSGSDRETENHKEGVIHRMPSGSSKDYYVYW